MIFDMPKNESPIIKVLGVGGGGSNAVNHMYKQGIIGVDFAICNTDAQAMEVSPVPTKIQLGPELTEGRGAGSKPQVGKLACEESIQDVKQYLENNCKMLFITAGMGGGTGTGAAPIIAKTARDMGILTVAIITLPFTFEGRRRTNQGLEGLAELKENVDTIIIVSNDKLRQIYGNLSISGAFAQADNILTTAAKGIAEIITVPGYVNVDFEDVNTVMRQSGVAIMGTASAEGDDRAKRAVDEALHSPLLEDNDIRGAQHILLNITSGHQEVTMDEIFEITEFVQEEAGYGTDLIWGNCYDETLGEKISVTVIATGFKHRNLSEKQKEVNRRRIVSLEDDREIKDQPKTGLSDIGFEKSESTQHANTYEFDDVRASLDKFSKMSWGQEEPGIKSNDKNSEEEMLKKQRYQESQKRQSRVSLEPPKLSNPKAVIELENQPAYLRRGISLDDVPHSAEEDLSNWSVGEVDETPIIKEQNSFLHGNVD
ncbi:MAG: cell division protein FtsZ [Bacteroidota bacterium]